ncbi:hypothetical protein HRI_001590400 [Hibiscus trionum]|uniref:Integrase catalytic domain-containing protein n=1 Tax=Hibiscus trionum TaxID=183268 RepID=A0A9W7HLC8_HIBTR|nr:hypothetical protein HRI_001590400 [Hibiscus trionum]
MSSSYHPQTDGQTEALNRCLEMYLRCMVAEEPRKWETYLMWAEYWYNTAHQMSAGMTPFKALYGRNPHVLSNYIEGSSKNDQVSTTLNDRDAVLRELKHNLSQAQLGMKNQADQYRRELEFQEGYWVFVRLQPCRQMSLKLHQHQKLSPKFFGPYQIVKRIGAVAYQLELPPTAKIHPVFHISKLKLCRDEPLHQITPLPLLMDATTPDLDDQLLNLEDKVLEKGKGNVVNANVAQHKGGNEVDKQQPTKINHEAKTVTKVQDVRRGTRKKLPPCTLTDYVRY